MKYKMLHYGSAIGIKSGRTYRFDRGEIIEAEEGEFNTAQAEKEQKEEPVKVRGRKAKKASGTPQGEKRA